jgi:hypothetical protein
LTKTVDAWWAPSPDVDEREIDTAVVPLELVVDIAPQSKHAGYPGRANASEWAVAEEATLIVLDEPAPLEAQLIPDDPVEHSAIEGFAGGSRRSAGRRLLVAAAVMVAAAAVAVPLMSQLGTRRASRELDASAFRPQGATHDLTTSAIRILQVEHRARVERARRAARARRVERAKRAARARARRAAAHRRRTTIKRARTHARSPARTGPSRRSRPLPAPPPVSRGSTATPVARPQRSQPSPAQAPSDPATRELGIGPGS